MNEALTAVLEEALHNQFGGDVEGGCTHDDYVACKTIAADIIVDYGEELARPIRRDTILSLFETIPDGSRESFKDQESQAAVSYRMGWLAAKLWLKRQAEEHQ